MNSLPPLIEITMRGQTYRPLPMLSPANKTPNNSIHFLLYFQAYFEDLAEKEKVARLLNEPSPLVDFLNDDLILSGNLDDQPKKNKCNGKEKSKNDCNFNIDQFPSLPQPRNGSLLE